MTLEKRDDQVFLIKALIAFRLVIVSFFLGALAIFQMNAGGFSYPLPIFSLVAVTYLLSIVYLFLIPRISRYIGFISFQLFADLLIASAVIYLTGGVVSPFSFLFIFTIIASAIVLSRPASYIIASQASILYGILAVLEFHDIINPYPLLAFIMVVPSPAYVFFTVLANITAFYLVAFFSDFLSIRLRETLLVLTSKSRDLTYLQAFHENVITNMGSGFLALGLDKTVISYNKAAEEILGIGGNMLKGKSLGNIFQSMPLDGLLPSLSSGSAWVKKAECPYRTPAGDERFISSTATPFRDSEGHIHGFIIIFQDISHFRKMEEAIGRAEKLAAIGRVAAGFAHEIRNPLGSISGSIQMLKGDTGNGAHPLREKLMDIILRETERLNNIINAFLSAASPSTRKQTDMNLLKIINDAVLLFRNDKEYSENLLVEVEGEEAINLEVDPEAMKQVLWNLMINAAQAMSGKGVIRIEAVPADTANGAMRECRITVTDTGVGISEEERTKIFEPFYTTKEKGTGLGLATVLKIVENHSGTVAVSSTPGKGTSFTITLPTRHTAA